LTAPHLAHLSRRKSENMPRNDFTPEQRRAWQKQRLLEHPDKAYQDAGRRMTDVKAKPKEDVKAKPKEDQLTKSIKDFLKPAKERQASQTIVAPQVSSCFADLRWKDDVATATFYRGGAIVYEYEMSRAEFKEWIGDGDTSLGEEFNDWIR
jgi:hypothetical protein